MVLSIYIFVSVLYSHLYRRFRIIVRELKEKLIFSKEERCIVSLF